MRTSRLAALLLAAAGAAWGQPAPYPGRRTPPPPKATAPTAAKTQKQAAKPDSLIEADIRARFAKSKISADKFQVHVQGGVATIEGKTDVIQHKGVATRLAKSAGAVAVNNHVQPAMPPNRKPPRTWPREGGGPRSNAATQGPTPATTPRPRLSPCAASKRPSGQPR